MDALSDREKEMTTGRLLPRDLLLRILSGILLVSYTASGMEMAREEILSDNHKNGKS
ncbi:MAG: hypothetical protein AAF824_23055 [Bacteroidota bacterium]